MGLLTKEVEVGLSNNIKHYESLGYIIPRIKNNQYKMVVPRGTKLLVKVEDLIDGSKVLVDAQCDSCGEKSIGIHYGSYMENLRKNNKYYCNKCANHGYKKYISFYEWCYKNLLKEEADIIMLRWDYDLNIDKNGNVLTPQNISYGSGGFDKKGYWFKCLDYPKHKSEQKNLCSFTSGSLTTLGCNQCNTISITHPYMINYLVNKDDIFKYSKGSDKKVPMKCPDCGYEFDKSIYHIIHYGFSCKRCSDGISYPQKFLFNVLEQLNLNFKTELTKTIFKWCNKYRYDFYINNFNCIIETHGLQHYKEMTGHWKSNSLKDIQKNDKQKEILAKENGIVNYIVIDCRKSELEWIKNSIMNSKLPQLLNFTKDDIDWLKCHEFGCSNRIKDVCNLWNGGLKSIPNIAIKLKLSKGSILKYLKLGVSLNWCDYDGKEESCRKIVCITTGEIFDSITSARNKYNVHIRIYPLDMNNIRSSGKHPITGEKLIWMYYEDYIIKTEKEIEYILKMSKDKKILCLNTGEVFDNLTNASNKYNIKRSGHISECCKNKRNYSGIHPETGERLRWAYYN